MLSTLIPLTYLNYQRCYLVAIYMFYTCGGARFVLKPASETGGVGGYIPI